MGRVIALMAGGLTLALTPFAEWEVVTLPGLAGTQPLTTGWGHTQGRLCVLGGVALMLLGLTRIRTRRGAIAACILSVALVFTVSTALGEMPGDNVGYPWFSHLPVRVTAAPWIALGGAIVALLASGVRLLDGCRHAVTTP